MADFLSFMTAAGWIDSLARQYAKVRGARTDEIEHLANEFGDPADLARYYIHPNCAVENPVDRDEDDDMHRPSQPLYEILEDFFARDIIKRDGRRHLFLMADAGMGKTSALVMLRLAYINKFWPDKYECKLFKLGPKTIKEIEAIESKRHTILLLDALDEDSKVIDVGVEDRLLRLVNATKHFHRVVITCRTQFFPGVIERPGKIRISDAWTCQSLYLKPFTDGQVERYLERRFPQKWHEWLLGREPNARKDASALAKSIRSLRARPMLLNHLEDLVKGNFAPDDEFGVYRYMVEEWLERESRKSHERHLDDSEWPRLRVDELSHACATVAIWLQSRGRRLIEENELQALIQRDSRIGHLKFVDVGGRSLLNRTSEGEYRFSHYSIQEFLVAFAAVHGRISTEHKPRATNQMLRFVSAFTSRHGDVRTIWASLEWRHLSRDVVPALSISAIALADVSPMSMLLIPGGSFWMGSDDGDADERPRHRVNVSWFELSAHPVTQRQWEEVMKSNPSDVDYGVGDQLPVQNISWLDAVDFLNGLSEREGLEQCYEMKGEEVIWHRERDGYRLPTEAEWEYACRAGTETAFSFGDDEADLEEYAWYEKNAGNKVHAVGTRQPNGWGLYDMHGNVWEWVWDWYHDEYPSEEQHDPTGPAKGYRRVLRGGSFGNRPEFMRSAFRYGNWPEFRVVNIGLRVARGRAPQHDG